MIDSQTVKAPAPGAQRGYDAGKKIEPTLCHQNWILNPLRLPIPPRPHIAADPILAVGKWDSRDESGVSGGGSLSAGVRFLGGARQALKDTTRETSVGSGGYALHGAATPQNERARRTATSAGSNVVAIPSRLTFFSRSEVYIIDNICVFGAPDRIRTCDLCLRSASRRFSPLFFFARCDTLSHYAH